MLGSKFMGKLRGYRIVVKGSCEGELRGRCAFR